VSTDEGRVNGAGSEPAADSGWLMSWAGDGDQALLEVTASGAAAVAVSEHAAWLVDERVASRIAAKDAGLWAPAAQAASTNRLGWTGLHTTTRAILPELEALRAELAAEGIDRVVVAGMGGSSLAAEVIAASAGVPLVVLDTTEPGTVRAALAGDLARTVLVVASKSGSTVETDSQRRVFEAAFTAAGLDASRHLVVVTDPGSPLEQTAGAAGYRAIFLADPSVGGRFSALSAFGVVPAALAGVDVAALLDEAAAVADILAEDAESNPAVVLAAAVAGTSPLRDKLVVVDDGSGLVDLADWVEHLVAQSTGKAGTGLLPVVTHCPDGDPPELSSPAADVLGVRLVALVDEVEDPIAEPATAGGHEVTVAGALGAQFLLWEYATAIAGRLLGINPFDQPDVESARSAAEDMLDAPPKPPTFIDAGIEARSTPGLLDDVDDVAGAIDTLLGTIGPDGYLAVTAFLDREANADLAAVRDALAARTGRPVTFGWGPRTLHSTGQLHKGGAPVGVYLQLTDEPAEDLQVPDRPFTFGRLIRAQAAGDARVLADLGRPVLCLHLADQAALARVTGLLRTTAVPA